MFILYTISQGKSEFIGRTVTKPHVKLAEELYTKPQFPPSLEWYELTRGPDHAGELLATFELLHVSYKICFKVFYSKKAPYASRGFYTCRVIEILLVSWPNDGHWSCKLSCFIYLVFLFLALLCFTFS